MYVVQILLQTNDIMDTPWNILCTLFRCIDNTQEKRTMRTSTKMKFNPNFMIFHFFEGSIYNHYSKKHFSSAFEMSWKRRRIQILVGALFKKTRIINIFFLKIFFIKLVIIQNNLYQ